jgi:hypothetical protein
MERERKLTFKVLASAHSASSWLTPPPLHTPESPPFFRLLKLWKLKAFKTKL